MPWMVTLLAPATWLDSTVSLKTVLSLSIGFLLGFALHGYATKSAS